MARIPLVDPDDADADQKARALLLRLRARSGRDINVLRALANTRKSITQLWPRHAQQPRLFIERAAHQPGDLGHQHGNIFIHHWSIIAMLIIFQNNSDPLTKAGTLR